MGDLSRFEKDELLETLRRWAQDDFWLNGWCPECEQPMAFDAACGDTTSAVEELLAAVERAGFAFVRVKQ